MEQTQLDFGQKTELISDSEKVFFERMTSERRGLWKKQYERLIAIEEGTLPVEFNKITKKPIEHTRMPWMLNAWKMGLKSLNKVIDEKG